MKTEVLFFGNIAEKINLNKITIDNCLDIDTLKMKLIEQFPQLNNLTYSVALGNSIINKNQKLSAGDVVAILPPFSGG